jgi:hypothetical protein
VIARHAGVSVAAARQALLAHEKNGTAIRVKGGRPGIPDTWRPAVGPADSGLPAEAPGAEGTAGDAQPADEDGAAHAGQPALASAGGTAEGAEAGTAPGPDPAVTAEAAGNVLAIAQAADEAGKALAAGDLDAVLAALDSAREQAAQGRRVIKAAGSGRRAPAARPGELRGLVEEHLRKFPGTAFTPHQVGKVLTRSSGAVANALDKLVSLGIAELASDKPRSYRLAPAAPVPGAPGLEAAGTGKTAEATPSARGIGRAARCLLWQVLFRAAFPRTTLAPNKSCRVGDTADSECGGRRQVSTSCSWASSPAERPCPDEPDDEDRAMPGSFRGTTAGAKWGPWSDA